MALLHEWQAQRQQRQQELRSRQKQVSEDLAGFRENRVNMGREMRQFLIDRHNEIRRETHALMQETQLFLSDCQEQRDRDTRALMQALDNFYQTLAADTAQFLNHVTEERLMMATEQTKQLQDFHNYLNTSVAEFLQQSYDQRMDMKAELTEYLSNFITQLCSDVAAYLQEMNLQQQQMAQELQQTFQADREQRSQTMQSLYRHFANSRLERQQDLLNLQTEMWRNVKAYRANLFNQVWGDIHAPTIAVPKTSKKVARSSPNLVEQAIVSPQAIASPPPSPAAQTQAVPQKQPPSSSQSRSAIMQKAVYDYIKQVKTARLKDIEETLNINRVQTVDILKSLMAKGLVTQNNRDYIVVETN